VAFLCSSFLCFFFARLGVLFLPSCVQNNWTALTIASFYGHTAIVKLLLEAGADKEAKSKVC